MHHHAMNMGLQELLKDIIMDGQSRILEPGSPRDLIIETLPRKASICMGVRRCGKSTFMEGIMQQLAEGGVSRENMVWINFADDRLSPLALEGLGGIHEAYYGMFPEKRHREKVYFFFDEIQIFPQWELFVERLRREEECDIYITGSSARMLSREIGTEMRGRSLSWELFPFSFGEYLTYRDIPRNLKGGSTQKLLIRKAWTDYRETGGFPETFNASPALRLSLHQEYFNALLFRDVVERNDVKQPRVLRQLAGRVVNQVGSLFSISKTCRDFTSVGMKVGRETLSQYMEWMQDAYFFFSVPAYDSSFSERERMMQKVYCVDHAMAASLGAHILKNKGQMLENMVFTGLRRVTREIYYYKTKQGYEVDFLAIRPDGGKMLVQACELLDDQTTKAREVLALAAAMEETGVRHGWILADSHQEEIKVSAGTIHCVPAPHFLMERELPSA